MQYINISDAKATLSALIEEVLKSGEQVVIAKMGKPLVTLSKYENDNKSKRIGALKNEIKIHDDFDEWPEDIARSLGMID
jgi:antitoxin (DNA-binding transcriptional repressor) of toxin-antitoxin stability system